MCEHATEEILRLEDVTLRRGSFLLNQIRFSVRAGEIVAILGRTGAGKTLLLETIAGFCRPEAGRVLCRERISAGFPSIKGGALPPSPGDLPGVSMRCRAGNPRLPGGGSPLPPGGGAAGRDPAGRGPCAGTVRRPVGRRNQVLSRSGSAGKGVTYFDQRGFLPQPAILL